MTEANAAAAPTRSESAADLLAELRRLEAANQIEIRIDPKRLNHIDSPVAFEADGNIWAYALVLAAAAATWARGWAGGGLALALGVIIYFTLGRSYVHRRIERRVRQDAINDLDKWRKLWRFSGLMLVAPDRAGISACASPDGNWMAFVRSAAAVTEPPP